jgi:tetratricopeptide (TPR) repeat protein
MSKRHKHSTAPPWYANAPLPLVAAALFFTGLALYWSSLSNPLVFDDFNLTQYDTRAYHAWQSTRFGPRWLSQASYWWINAALGTDMLWQRLTSVLLHAATAALLFGFLARLFAALLDDARLRWLAFFGALWFLLHPVAVYGVAYLVERSIVLATLFSVAALWCTLEGLQRRSLPWYAAAVGAYAMALFSKEHALMLPAAAFALAVLLRGFSLRFLWILLVLAVLGAIVALQRRGVIGAAYEPFAAETLAAANVSPAQAYPLSIVNQATFFFRYLATWLVPWTGWMSIDVRTHFPRELFGWPHALGFSLWLLYPVAAGWLLLRRGRLGLAGFALLMPWLLALTEFAAVRVQEPFVLYRSYLWMVCLPAAFPLLVARLSGRWQAALLSALCLALAAGALDRLATFANPVAIWDDALRKNTDVSVPRVERGWVNRGLAHLDAGRTEAAAADFARAIEINARSPDAWFARGILALRGGKFDAALADLDHAVALDPGYSAAFHKRCVVKAALGRMTDALADCDHAIALDPWDEEPWINRGAVYRQLGRTDEAAANYEKALALKPGSGAAHYNYGILLLRQGRRDLAVREHFVIACKARVAQACELLQRSRAAP